MGYGFEARCLDCDTKFMVREGTGMFAYILRCEKCGEETGFAFRDHEALFRKYADLLPGPYCVANFDNKEYDPETQAVINDFRQIVESIAGKCKCGGNYTFFALHRCPKCYSTRFEDTQTISVNFD